MARTRLDLHAKLSGIPGVKKAYYRPPSIRMEYPCIKYDLEGDDPAYADNIPYIDPKRWSVIVIDENPDSEIPERLRSSFQYCSFDRIYEAENLNHFVYTIYF